MMSDRLQGKIAIVTGGVDILVNCAGVFGMQAFTDTVTPAGRLGNPQEMVGAAIFLASEERVGQTLNVDGGMYLN